MTTDKFVYEYLDRLSNSLKAKQEKFKDDLDSKVEKDIEKLKKELLDIIRKKPDESDLCIYIFKMMERVKNYHIKDGYWYYEDKKLCKAIGIDGKNGTDGKDGINGKDGVNRKRRKKRT